MSSDNPVEATTENSTATNTSTGDQNVQAGVINGNVEFNSLGSLKQHLVARYASQEEIREAIEQFVPPGGYADAARILDEDSVVVVCGRGAGRTHAAHRLLADSLGGSEAYIAHIDLGRSLGGISPEEIKAGRGYIWDAAELRGRPVPSADFAHCRQLVRAQGARLVVIADQRSQSGPMGADHTVQLTAPVAGDVADSMLRYLRPADLESPSIVLKSELAAVLDDRDPPEKAVRAARLAIRVAEGDLSVDVAVRDLRDRVGEAVARWFDGWDIREYAFAFTAAMLEHEPFDEVVRQAQNLDLALRKAQLPADKSPRPPRIFAKPKRELLADVQADVVERDHPRYDGLLEETVRFERQDWSTAVIRHVWAEYPGAHTVLLEWMSGLELLLRFPEHVRRALCLITADVPAHEPLRLILSLAQNHRFACRDLAASSLAHLADDHNLRPLVEKTIGEWMDSELGYRLACAALVQSTVFGMRDVPAALGMLGQIAKSPSSAAQLGVVVSVLRMLGHPEHRTATMERVMNWAAIARRGGLRQVTLNLGAVLGGFVEVTWFDGDDVRTEFPGPVRALVSRVLGDPEFGHDAIEVMSGLAHEAKWRKGAGDELRGLLCLLTDDLDWRGRFLLARRLIRIHPHKRRAIRHLLRAAAHREG